MQNLRYVHRSIIQAAPDACLTAIAWDVATDSAICAFGPVANKHFIELKRWSKHSRAFEDIASWDATCPLPDLDCDEVLDLHFFTDSLQSILVLAGGDLIVVREDPQDGEDKIEIVGSVDAGITAAAWSPDEELLAITTRASTLLYMTKDFDNIVDVTLSSADLSASQHVSVGWGKKETQFKGKKARALKDPTVPDHIDEGILSQLDDGKIAISWRGDGAYVALNSKIESDTNSRRVIRIFSREGILDSVSEPVNGLESCLSWRPAGNLIAGIQRQSGILRVVFFERNGLRHGQFDLGKEDALPGELVTSLRWNSDSSVLAVCFSDRVQLWTMSNYHYYLKQEVFPSRNSHETGQPAMLWHPEKPLHLLVRGHGKLQRLAYAAVVASHPTFSPYDQGLIAVIDGAKLKVTPLRVANVPPPMALCELELPSSIIDVSTTMGKGIEAFSRISVLHHHGISLFDWPIKSMLTTPPSVVQNFNDSPGVKSDGDTYLQIHCTGAHIMVLGNNQDRANLRCIEINSPDDQDVQIDISDNIEGFATKLPEARETVSLLSTRNVKNHSHELDGDASALGVGIRLLEVDTNRVQAVTCPKTFSNIQGSEDGPSSMVTLFSLAENGSLYANKDCLLRNCTSFAVTPAHLLYTTSQHLLKIAHLSTTVLNLPPDTPEADERCRSIERGARIVSVIPSIFAVVLQMPRGNLETIYPRALVLAGIRKSVDGRKYKKALMACRAHRVDMNILHDHAPDQFLASIESFIEQVHKIEHIDLFLSQLREENVAKTMYRETLTLHKDEDSIYELKNDHSDGSSKVNQICNAFIHSLKNRSNYTQNLISAYVCQNPPNLDEGLKQIAEMRAQKSDQVDTAIEHICFLADVNKLYDHTLGLYDLELAILVAQQSQKDPREYIPFLQSLQKMPDLRRKFSIDDYLKRYEKALGSLHQLDSFDEFRAYTAKHKLYTVALEHCRYQDEKLSEITRIYAEHLQSESKYKEAAIAYESLLDYVNAVELFRRANLWKESLACANLLPLPEAEIKNLARGLVLSAMESKDFFAAATIQNDYLDDRVAAAQAFCKGYHFADAFRLVASRGRSDLLASVIDRGLEEGMASMVELIADCKAQLNAQVPRIKELRQKKVEDPLSFYDGEGAAEGADIPDNISLAPTDASTTGGSLFTRYTNRSTGTLGTNATRRTSRHQRREERKKARGKKGSVYEEEYLVNSVRRLVERVNSVNQEVQRLVDGLLRRAMRERARAVESGMRELVDLCRDSVVDVFGSTNGQDAGAAAAAGQASVPLVEGFQKSLLLGS